MKKKRVPKYKIVRIFPDGYSRTVWRGDSKKEGLVYLNKPYRTQANPKRWSGRNEMKV